MLTKQKRNRLNIVASSNMNCNILHNIYNLYTKSSKKLDDNKYVYVTVFGKRVRLTQQEYRNFVL